MDIEWLGHSCFRLREQGVTIITDPYDKSVGYVMPRVKADIVTVSHESPGHSGVAAVKGEPKILNKPGEYEIKGVFITGVQTWLEIVKDQPKEENVVFVFEFGDLTICHLGDVAKVLTQAQVEALPDIDVLLVPVGGHGSLDADKAAQVVSLLEPHIVVPMHYRTDASTVDLDPIGKFMKEMGVTEQAPQESLRVTRSELPQETQTIILEYKQG